MKMDRNAPTLEVLNSRVRYDPETGDFYALKTAGRRKAGDRLGYADTLGYWKIFLGGWILSHRAAWFITYGEWPEGEIDHINGNPGDNRIANLRIATRSENVANKKFDPLNTSGFRGVSRVNRQRTADRYQASIGYQGKTVYIGIYDTPEEAHQAYLERAHVLYGEFFPDDAQDVFVAKPAYAAPTQEVLL